MAFKPNYGQKRAERARAQEEKRNERVRDQHERTLQRRAELDVTAPSEDEKPSE
jgi:hypothetical protein